ncbi:hypothetical protein TRFO_32222 [Tritrichomonas foetus]|uniref:TPR Domain containing protein n=1 Tax=Tritrichomonas foetus TaxID=1144522 RepID=A0A1J4JP51_9EUKA|nr:hypothetical protein TRFO_32222 [Tritrichomonas foetus]|eukprot:OHT00927.1 hypothetical protein TRFO_32222 [Tritrichomonas foetus]
MDSPTITSFEYVKQAIQKSNVTQAIDDFAYEFKNEENKERKVLLKINSAIAKISIQMLRGCIFDCDQSIAIDPTSMAYFIKGLAYLWMGNEKEAISIWKNGINQGGHIYYYTIMNRLISDPNARSFFYSKRYNIVEIMDFVENFDREKIFTDNETQAAYTELRKNALQHAIIHFNLILANDPDNIEAIRGRAIAECFSGMWKKAIDDFTIVIQRKCEIELCSKFRAVAYAAIGNYTAAIADFSTAITLGHIDFVPISERGRLHMLRKSYNLALQDFKRIPKGIYDDRMRVNIAECYYAIGDLPRAFKYINRVTEIDHRKEYCHYLICRDINKSEDALYHLKKAIENLPTFFLIRTAADFCYELGRYFEALNYYKQALRQKEEDADTQRLYALTLFQTGSEMACIEILKGLKMAWDVQKEEIDFSQESFDGFLISGHLKNFYQYQPTQSILKTATDDLIFLTHVMMNSKYMLLDTTREYWSQSVIDKMKIPELFHCVYYTPDEIEIQMCRDADRLGKKCIPSGFESTENERITRSIGFCVLFLAYTFKTECFSVESDYKYIIELLRPLLQLGDLSKDIRNVNNNDTIIHVENAPAYFLQRGEKIIPKYKHVLNLAISQFNAQMNGVTSSLVFAESVDDLYSMAQKDTSVDIHWASGSQKLIGCSLNLKYLGVNGFDFFVRPPLNMNDVRKLENRVQELWNTVMRLHNTQISSSLAALLCAMWNLQPFSCFNNELGHIILHAFILASFNCEAPKFCGPNGEDMCMKFMVMPSEVELERELNKITLERKTETIVQQTSIDFWEDEQSFAHLQPLMSYKYD